MSLKKRPVLAAAAVFLVLAAASYASNPFIVKAEEKDKRKTSVLQNDCLKKLVMLQAKLNRKVSAGIEDYRERRGAGALVVVLGMLFVYGFLHALGPGHGKAVVSAWVVSSRKKYVSVAVVSVLSAGFHALTAVLIVSVSYLVLRTLVSGEAEAVKSILLGAAGLMLFLIGAYMLLKVCFFFRKNSSAVQDLRKKKEIHPVLVALAVGIVPCPASSVILIFSYSFGLIAEGLLFVFVFASGMALTQILIASGAWQLREKAEAVVFGKFRIVTEKILPVFASVVLMFAGFIILLPYLY
ncbi:MAG TPA: hypothetical protein ENN43_03965 [bacterium]|nr:hypothetical protein [bacterium]